ncbi:MAG TPA: head GIN domain-containing protein [Bacteroidales bacterium]|nr:head GIN domain-containing protein [Bacteroidales bacterium]
MKNHKFTSIILAVLFITTASNCNTYSADNNYSGSQDSKREVRNVDKFSAIGLSVSADVYVTQGSPQKVELEGAASDLEKIVTEVDGNKLKIKTQPGTWHVGKVKAYITVENINSLSVSGSGSLFIEKSLETDELNLAVSGSGSIDVKNLKANSIESAISGSGEIRLSGGGKVVESQRIAISGSGDLYAESLETRDAEVHVSGSGECKLFVSGKLDASVSGSGDVYYKGEAVVKAHVSGSGKVRKM